MPPGRMDPVHGDRGVKGEYQTEEAKQEAEPHTGAPFQEPANPQGDKKRRDKNDHCDRVSLCFGKCVEHQARSISESSSLKSFLVKSRQKHEIWNGNPESFRGCPTITSSAR